MQKRVASVRKKREGSRFRSEANRNAENQRGGRRGVREVVDATDAGGLGPLSLLFFGLFWFTSSGFCMRANYMMFGVTFFLTK